MYCLHISNLPSNTQSVFFKCFPSAPTILDVIEVLCSLGYSLNSTTSSVTSVTSVKETSPTSWDVIQTTTITSKGWLWGKSTLQSQTKLFSFTSLPLIYNPSFTDNRSKSTQTPKSPDGPCLKKTSTDSSVSSCQSTNNYSDVVDELKLKLQLPNFGLGAHA